MRGQDIILGLLMEKSRTGYEINEVFETSFKHFYKTSYGMIYPTLKKLQDQELVEKNVIIQEDKPNKNVFNITQLGIEEFYQYLDSPIAPEKRESEFLVRLYLGKYVTKEVLIEWIKQEIKEKETNIQQLKENYTNWKSVMTYSQHIPYEIGIKQFEAELEILTEKIKELEVDGDIED